MLQEKTNEAVHAQTQKSILSLSGLCAQTDVNRSVELQARLKQTQLSLGKNIEKVDAKLSE
jgi:hypothetical protein